MQHGSERGSMLPSECGHTPRSATTCAAAPAATKSHLIVCAATIGICTHSEHSLCCPYSLQQALHTPPCSLQPSPQNWQACSQLLQRPCAHPSSPLRPLGAGQPWGAGWGLKWPRNGCQPSVGELHSLSRAAGEQPLGWWYRPRPVGITAAASVQHRQVLPSPPLTAAATLTHPCLPCTLPPIAPA